MALSRLQRTKLVWLWGYRPADIAAYGFADGRPATDAGRYLGSDWNRRFVQDVVNDPRNHVLTEHKWVFYRFADGFGLPVPPTIGFFDSVQGTTWDGERPLRTVPEVLAELDRQRPSGLVVKPAGGGQGAQIVILDRIDHATGTATTRTGEETTLERVFAALDPGGERGVSGYVLQHAVRNHPELAPLAPTTTNTCRVLTTVAADGTAHVHAASIRLGRRGGMIDNWGSGGVSIPIDVATGVMGPGILKGVPGDLTEHPDTGERFAGRELPLWQETVELCRRAAVLFPGLRFLGWDVVIGPDGPVLLEGNVHWSLRGSQMLAADGWLADPDTRERVECLGVPLPTGRVSRQVAAGMLLRGRDRARRVVRRAGRTLTSR
ncbi:MULTISPECIES: sugar-transfer associated ATP-grasp domain-containing protein [unclassified Modestobacter]|uniref:sugar-transfer associated ATP-grasp domain-containing protein n=1 Tax=unclassified Modestobacter TaxID=2643866 RepID=UPI0022AA3394|nr:MULTISPECIES: sugar-transfer associated ATP-grasp domain-containing protein [unclassified Modestobacter]MCZ2813409.1 hypothetical protein [Modestobacter sp. VKM Ac-2979]MCZ2842399.1 hypothetical protein [Modestobacter sp. VKM Ac-2980]MCZ2846569.1 hypothetical protein [Modestobacter sp. VKM Ac-2978]